MYESIMWTYIQEEQTVLPDLLKNPEMREIVKNLSEMKAVYFVAHGSSYNAANAIAPLITKLAKLRVYVYTPSQVLHNEIPLFVEDNQKICVCGISQTGTSRGVLEALELIEKFQIPIIGITDVKDSPLEKQSDYTFHLNCHGEDSNAKTKGYSSTLLVLCMFAIEMALAKNLIKDAKAAELYQKLAQEIDDLKETADKVCEWCRENTYGKGMSNIYVVGNGINYATAMEGQLKLMETVCIPTMFSNIEEFSHGMHRSLKEDSYVLLLDTQKGHALTEKTYSYLCNKHINVLMLSNQTNNAEQSVICLPEYELTDSVFLFTEAIQVISVYVPEINGEDPNRCANDDYTECVATRV